MSGWTFAGWLAAAIALYALVWMRQRHEEEMVDLHEENATLWDQVRRFDEAWVEKRARQAVTN